MSFTKMMFGDLSGERIKYMCGLKIKLCYILLKKEMTNLR